MKTFSSIISLFALIILVQSQSNVINRPIIAILTIPTSYENYPNTTYNYMAASYAKFIESGGAQVVPLQFDLPLENITYILDRVNGVLFTGGSGDIVNTTLGNTMAYIVNYVIEQNKNGNYYPLWGTCMGFETIACILAEDYSVLTPDCVDCIDVNSNNFFNENYQSRMFSQLPDDLREKMATANLSLFDHVSMIHADAWGVTYPLNTSTKAVTYSYDAVGTKFVSSFESPTLPIYAIQFHAEKAAFEWKDGANHSLDAVRLQQYLSNFFVNETKKNNNTFPDQASYIIDNFETTIIPDSSFNTVYVFNNLPNVSLDAKPSDLVSSFLQF